MEPVTIIVANGEVVYQSASSERIGIYCQFNSCSSLIFAFYTL
jgi:hypothetical protein